MKRQTLFFFSYLTHIFIVKVQELACTVRYGINKTLIPKTYNKRNHRLQSPKRWPKGRAPLTVTTHERKETHEILGVPSRHGKMGRKSKERITVVGRKEKKVRGRRLVEDRCGEDWLANNSRERERGK